MSVCWFISFFLTLVESPSEEAIHNMARQATVSIHIVATGAKGSGVLIAQQDGFLYGLTAAHVVDKENKFKIERFDAKGAIVKTYLDVDVLFRAKDCDVALFRIPSEEKALALLPLASDTFSAKLPLPVWTVGNETDKPTLETDDILARKLVRKKGGIDAFFWETKKAQQEGRSGGPLLTKQGQLIGICSGTQNGKGYYTHLDELRAILKKHKYESLLK